MKAGFFALSLAAIVLAGAAVAGAQRSRHEPPPPAPTAPLPPAPAALSVPNPLAGLKPGPRDLYQSPDGSDRFQHLGRHPGLPVLPPGGYFPGPYGYAPLYYPGPYTYGSFTADTPYSQRHHELPRGGLVLQTIPDSAQVFVDGYYVGLAEEFGLRGRAMDVAAGSHRIELRAPDYEPLAFSVMITPNDIVRYRGEMQPLASRERPVPIVAAPQMTPKSVYVIPNCYAGDKPPSTGLPKGCDIKNLQTRK